MGNKHIDISVSEAYDLIQKANKIYLKITNEDNILNPYTEYKKIMTPKKSIYEECDELPIFGVSTVLRMRGTDKYGDISKQTILRFCAVEKLDFESSVTLFASYGYYFNNCLYGSIAYLYLLDNIDKYYDDDLYEYVNNLINAKEKIKIIE